MTGVDEGEDFRDSLIASRGEDSDSLFAIESCVAPKERDDLHTCTDGLIIWEDDEPSHLSSPFPPVGSQRHAPEGG